MFVSNDNSDSTGDTMTTIIVIVVVLVVLVFGIAGGYYYYKLVKSKHENDWTGALFENPAFKKYVSFTNI